MNLNLVFKDQKKTIGVDDAITCKELKERVSREFFLSPSFTKIFFNKKILLGDQCVTDFGVEEGSEIVVEAAGL